MESFRTVGRVAQAGDYYYIKTPQLGTERTGPDLSQEGGVHTDEWHLAHFRNPRYTYPKSIMPEFSFYYTGDQQDAPNQEIYDLIAYVQSLGGKAADDRTARQKALKQKLLSERAKGNEAIIHDWFPSTWRNVRNPMEPTQRSLIHGKTIFQTNCIGCHGLRGDGKGPAARWIGGQYAARAAQLHRRVGPVAVQRRRDVRRDPVRGGRHGHARLGRHADRERHLGRDQLHADHPARRPGTRPHRRYDGQPRPT